MVAVLSGAGGGCGYVNVRETGFPLRSRPAESERITLAVAKAPVVVLLTPRPGRHHRGVKHIGFDLFRNIAIDLFHGPCNIATLVEVFQQKADSHENRHRIRPG